MSKQHANGAVVGDFLSEAMAAAQPQPVTVPGIKRKVFARPISALAMRQITESCLLPGKKLTDGEGAFDNEKLNDSVVCATIVDQRGNRLIPVGREDEIRKLPNAVYATLVSAAMKANNPERAANAGN